jgi:hypothetical protein
LHGCEHRSSPEWEIATVITIRLAPAWVAAADRHAELGQRAIRRIARAHRMGRVVLGRIAKRLLLVLGTHDPELHVAARASEEAAAFHELTLDVVLGRGVMSRPHLPPLIAMSME